MSTRAPSGFWIDPDRLDAAQRAELAALLPDRLGREGIDRFIDATAEAVSSWEQSRWTIATAGPVREQLDKVEAAAKRLQAALAELDQTTLHMLHSHMRVAHVVPRERLPAGSDLLRTRAALGQMEWLDALPGELECLRSLVEYANRVQPSNEPRDRLEAKLLAAGLVRAYVDVFGKSPPRSDWFFNFAAKVGTMAGTTVGKRAVLAAL
jgi:hypothetical protein